ncbi:chemotaxis protein CheB [Paucibacter sp. R3-3]|uniref:protein-glutamate O-methyltransferase n=1 Tax=Roseateles agri TaxID=3098619 RepID=A0ABU5DMN4_9BURK|nr:chemotaxis protein CheB [Paucibacter sp. R3-3]MDY0747561.1 chemotaxis protein CheB [Paucibacter sp. R3-3]
MSFIPSPAAPLDPPHPMRIVGLGASAGGLTALEQFLAHVPAHSGLAYVVVQHMDPNHKALLVELLQRSTTMPVIEATHLLRIDVNSVYVIPPNRDLTVVNGHLHLARPIQPRGMRLPVDVLFGSLARDQRELAVGVVLSGMGSDGTQGLQAIKAHGGLTLAQQPSSAQFDAMPSSAIKADSVDIVALASEMPARILAATAHGVTALAPAVGQLQGLAEILDLLREHSKHDLSPYKTSTLTRRVERRLSVHSLNSMHQYAEFVRQNPRELDLLFKEMLIGVTSFFRDPAVWDEMKEKVFPGLLKGATQGTPLRAWVAGCSTGEEAYSLAMVFRETADAMQLPPSVTLQIFATDLSADAITIARRGMYSAKVAADMSPERFARFFSPQGEGVAIAKDIRDMVLFAQHDVILDPPFTKLDLLSCRNLMIYFNAALQRRLIPLFHYSLKSGGTLLLGASETVGRASSLFTPLGAKSRLYRRDENPVHIRSVAFPINPHFPLRPTAQESLVSLPTPQAANLQVLADQVLLQEFAPPAVLVNEQGDIIYISGRTGRYLEPAAGKANWNIHAMARAGIRAQVGAALRRALQDNGPVELHGLKPEGDLQWTVDVTVKRIEEPNALAGMAMIVFREQFVSSAPVGQRHGAQEADDPAALEELTRANEEIRALRQEMRASAEELQASNEELQSTNEELQSANEELTTSKEEAQSMNEELQTINAELHSKLEDLAMAHSDMQNLLNSTDIATLFLDSALNVRRFTEQIKRIVHLRESDVGRPLSELASTLVYPDLHVDALETLRTLVASEKQIRTTDERWFTVRIMPYRTVSNVIQGVVITFVDITAAKILEARLRSA